MVLDAGVNFKSHHLELKRRDSKHTARRAGFFKSHHLELKRVSGSPVTASGTPLNRTIWN